MLPRLSGHPRLRQTLTCTRGDWDDDAADRYTVSYRWLRAGTPIPDATNPTYVTTAADAATSLTKARKHRPDLIVLDLGLPGGDGFLVMERLKMIPDLAVIPVIIVSGRDVHANHERALKAGARAFLQKPVENAELLKAIRVALGETVEVKRPPELELELEEDSGARRSRGSSSL